MEVLNKLIDGDPVQIFKRSEVEDLLTKGYVRKTVVHLPGRKMVPDDQVAVNITRAGRSYVARQANTAAESGPASNASGAGSTGASGGADGNGTVTGGNGAGKKG